MDNLKQPVITPPEYLASLHKQGPLTKTVARLESLGFSQEQP